MKIMFQIAWRVIASLFCLYVCIFPTIATELPTLMYSSSEREAINEQRLVGEGTIKNQQIVRHSGIVQRSDGNNAVWLNEKLSQKGDAMYPTTNGTSILLEGQELRVGDQWDMVNRTKKTLVPQESMQKRP